MRRAGGFTLVEMLVAVASALLVLAAVGGLSRAEGRAFDRQAQRLRLREAGRRVLAMMTREIRAAGFAPVAGSFDGAVDGLAIAESDRLEIRGDFHGAAASDPPDGELDAASDEAIGFFLAAARGGISQTVGRQTQPLTLDDMVPPRGLALRYFDACGDEIVPASGGALDAAERQRVRRVAIWLAVRGRDGQVATDETIVTLRNRSALRCE